MRIRHFLLGIALGLAAAATPAHAEDPHVVVISIDGLPGFYIDDPKAELPNLRGLIARGAVAKGGMAVSNPSVTWPNHTTMMTGLHPASHGVIYNGVIERGGVDLPTKTDAAKSQKELTPVPLLFDILKEAGKTSAAINWPCTRDSKSIDDNMPDVPGMLESTTPRLKQDLELAGLLEGFSRANARSHDQVWAEATCRVLRERKPALTVLHVLNLDSTHHANGPSTEAGYDAARFADGLVGRVLESIEAAGLGDSTTVFVVSDHGFIGVTASLRPNVALRRAGLLEVDDKGSITKARAQVIPEGGIGLVYLSNPETAREDAAAVRKLFEGATGIAAVVGPEEFGRYNLPDPAGYGPMADMILACKPGFSIAGASAGEDDLIPQAKMTGSHGYLSTEPAMNATFIAAGPAIKPGRAIEGIRNVDLAPTVMKILGVPLSRADGRVLDEILAKP
ncbi:MAG: ectonucleotide pyrophosphatase/phosphodiesterase [Isosphaeraceae bacterium]